MTDFFTDMDRNAANVRRTVVATFIGDARTTNPMQRRLLWRTTKARSAARPEMLRDRMLARLGIHWSPETDALRFERWRAECPRGGKPAPRYSRLHWTLRDARNDAQERAPVHTYRLRVVRL